MVVRDSSIVLDASAALALGLSESEGPIIEGVIAETIEASSAVLVPALFWYEVGNGLLMAERRGRISPQLRRLIAGNLGGLLIEVDAPINAEIRARIDDTAAEHSLTYYNAAYLELALRRRLRLKTLDEHLLALKSVYEFIF